MYAPQGILTEIAHQAGVSASRVALLVSAATFGLAVSVLPWAWLATRFGTRKALRCAASGAAVCGLLVPWLPSFDALVLGRLLQGVALGGIPALAMALPHDLTTPKRAASLGGSYVAATSLGGLGGRLLVVPVADHIGWRAALFALGCLVALLMIAMTTMIPDAGPSSARQSAGAALQHLRNPLMLRLFGIGALLVGGMVAIFNYLPFRLEQAPYLLTPSIVSLVFVVYLAGTAGSRAAGWLTSRAGEAKVLFAACLLLAAGAALTMVQPLIAILLGVTVLTAGLFIGHAVASSMVAAKADSGRQHATAFYNISYYAGSSLFGWLGGVAWVHGQWPLVAIFVAGLGVIACVFSVGTRSHA